VACGLAGGSATCAGEGAPHSMAMATAHAIESERCNESVDMDSSLGS
jgi:hypothetical protein